MYPDNLMNTDTAKKPAQMYQKYSYEALIFDLSRNTPFRPVVSIGLATSSCGIETSLIITVKRS
jgi:hypothetical protein